MTHNTRSPQPQHPINAVRYLLAVWLLSTLPALIVFVPAVSATHLVVQGGIGLLLLGVDVPLTRIPWNRLPT
ncbi:hypothetical protein [Kineococcus sp. R86509]|uniref:hypothetical protein n=1 Tax=Kineococcus sp. R86509 TaxID=3093851 RepID=UPI0036D3D0EB